MGKEPYIGLRGAWIKDAGFIAGTNIKIDIDHEKLTITPNTTIDLRKVRDGKVRDGHEKMHFK